MVWKVVVQIRKSNLIFGSDGLPDDDLVDVIQFIPVLIPGGRKQAGVNPTTLVRRAVFSIPELPEPAGIKSRSDPNQRPHKPFFLSLLTED